MSKQVFPVVVCEGESGHYVAHCLAIDGCLSQGHTITEAIENIQEAITLCLEVMDERGEVRPEPATTLLTEVAVET